MITVDIGGYRYTAEMGDPMAPPESLGGLDLTTLRMTEHFTPTGNQAHIEGVIHYSGPGTAVPKREQEIRVTFYPRNPDGTVGDADVLFGGVVEQVNAEVINQSQMYVNIDARDYMKWLDRKLVSGVYVEDTPGAMVRHILLDFGDMQDVYDPSSSRFYDAGIDVAFGSILPKAFSYRRLSEAIQEVADATDAIWWIDHTKGLHFIRTEDVQNQAPLPKQTVAILTRVGASITPSSPVAVLDLDAPYMDYDDEAEALLSRESSFAISNFAMEDSSVGLQNSLVVKDMFYRGVESLYVPTNSAGDGWGQAQTFDSSHIASARFPLPEIPYDLTEDDFSVEFDRGNGYYPLIVEPDPVNRLSNRTLQPERGTVFVGFGGRAGGPYIRWRPGAIRDGGEGVDTSTAYRIKLRPFYAALFSQTSRNTSSISYFAEESGGAHDGVFESLIDFGDLEFTGEDPIQAFEEFAANLLARGSWPVYNGSFNCLSSDITGWRARQRFYLTSKTFDLHNLQHWDALGRPDYDPNRPYHETRPVIPGIIKSITITVHSPDLLYYDIDWSSAISDV